MEVEKKDIIERIKANFQTESETALKLIKNSIKEYDYINHSRIIRSIIFLANGDIFELKHYLKMAISDWRDVIFFAEYETSNGSTVKKRVRDFNLTFQENEE